MMDLKVENLTGLSLIPLKSIRLVPSYVSIVETKYPQISNLPQADKYP